jgi:hypothetical protein
MTAITHAVELMIDYDQDCDNPLTSCDGMWTLYTGRDLEERMTDRSGSWREYRWIPDTLDLFWKLRNGLAWTVGGYLDGGSQGISVYVQEYDPSDRICGLLVWEHDPSDMGSTTKEGRRRDARSTLAEYERWANGECYGYALTGLDFAYDDSCWGFIGLDSLREAVQEALPDERPLTLVYANDRRTEHMAWGKSRWGDGVEVLTMSEYRARCRAEDVDEGEDLRESDLLDMEAA